MREAILSLDVGTTVIKAVLFDTSGTELDMVEQACQLHTPQLGWAELDPEELWQTVVGVLLTAASRSASRARILALALTTQGGTLIPCRTDGTPTYRAITWMDERSKELVAQWLAQGLGGRIRRISGWSPEPGLPLPSIGWLRCAHPDLFAATERFLSVNDFLSQRLTGHLATNPSMAGEMLLTDITTGQWSEELCSLVGIRAEQLSPILPSGAPLGRLRPEVGRLTGLDAQTVVFNGGQDHSCEALALGIRSDGEGMLACGTAWVINGIAETASVDSITPGMNLNYHVLPGRWVASQFLGGVGCLPGVVAWPMLATCPAAGITPPRGVVGILQHGIGGDGPRLRWPALSSPDRRTPIAAARAEACPAWRLFGLAPGPLSRRHGPGLAGRGCL